MKIRKEDVCEMISSILEVDIELIRSMNEDEDFAVYGMNSISAIKLVVKLEERYEFEFEDDDLLIERFNTFNKLNGYPFDSG